ncbi:hypothetical protein [Lentzea sp. NEAU-D7]|uniref:hypothetical protein n=1 Tax=Lentzea sp. NEAU-D7 TaxID=2994667 RepID=UPI00224B4098|nr:hypothetical protein [Lentzea sp. NEAU-D7]MCX2948440.1 hypothetical protein [Lentzea sp. NEAU-D7]
MHLPKARAQGRTLRKKPKATATAVITEPTFFPQNKRIEVIVEDRQRSTDVAWTTGDVIGLHVLATRANDDCTWRAITSLVEPGFETDQWSENACATAPGNELVVTHAPRALTDKPEFFQHGLVAVTANAR